MHLVRALYESQKTANVLRDLSKAFDCVAHEVAYFWESYEATGFYFDRLALDEVIPASKKTKAKNASLKVIIATEYLFIGLFRSLVSRF